MSDLVLSPYCVYTILHSEKLHAACEKGGKGVFKEETNWKSGFELMQESMEENQILPIIFAAAESTSKLLYWGRLVDIKIEQPSEKSFKTTYKFEALKRIEKGHVKTDLILRSSGRNISEGYIRPYSICRTPDFLK